MNRRRWAVVGAVAMVLGTAAAPQAVAGLPGGSGAASHGSAQVARPRSVAQVTLVTGDRVAVDAAGRVVEVTMGAGRAGVRWMRQVVNGHTFVLPADALRLLSRGVLDRRLFDVTQLVADRYDDAHRKQIPLIVSYAADAKRRQTAQRALVDADAEVQRDLSAVRGQALAADRPDTPKVWDALTDTDRARPGTVTTAPGVEHIWLDGAVRASSAPLRAAPAAGGSGTTQIGAPSAWKMGLDGRGVTVAVLDSGVDATHPDLRGKIVAAKDFTDSGSTDDKHGHGTHVASTVAGTGAASRGKYLGVAPGARLLAGKVLDDFGGGTESGIIAGMQWAADRGAKVVNMSLGGTDFFGQDPVERAVDRLSAARGTLFVIAAGNSGPGDTTLGSPGSAAAALTVAAVDHHDKLAPFSSRGPTADDVNLKPDISAPGVDIVAAKAAHGTMGDPADVRGYVIESGTSMAAPHVAGAAAILAQQHPGWTGAQLKAALMGSAHADPKLTAYEQGAGRVDLTRGVAATVLAEPASLHFGTQQWPHTDDRPVTRTLTYRNTGTAPVTLTLAASGVFTVAPATLTIAAGGTGTATATADTGNVADGVHSGAVTATAGALIVRTPALVVREAESYNLTLRTIDRDGARPTDASADVYSLDSGRIYQPYDRDTDGDYQVTVRLPKGRYMIDDVVTGDAGRSVLVAPNLALTRDTTLILDHRTAKPVKITAPDARARGGAQIVQWAANGPDPGLSYGMGLPAYDLLLGQVGPAGAAGQFAGQIAGAWFGPAASAPQYHIVVTRPGAFFTGLTHSVGLTTMARVDVSLGGTVARREARPNTGWTTPGFPQLDGLSPGIDGRPIPLPRAGNTLYLSAGGGLSWGLGFQISTPGERHVHASVGDLDTRRYEPGRTYRATYNVGVFGPLAAPSVGGWRRGDAMQLCQPMLSEGHMSLDADATKKTTLTAGGKTYYSTTQDTCATDAFGGLPRQRTRLTLTSDWRRDLRAYQVSNRVTAAWSFASQHYGGEGWQPLPLSAVRFHPALSLTNTTKMGRRARVPVLVQGAAATRGVRNLTVAVSYDGGRTWKPVVVQGPAGQRYLTLAHPNKPGTVSFRTALTDKDGNTYTATITNAYRLVR